MRHTATKKLLFLFICVGISLTATTTAFSQSIWFDHPDNQTDIGAEVLIPSFDHIVVDDPALAFYLYSHISLSDETVLKVDVPFSYFTNGGGESNAAIGNPYVGVRLRSQMPVSFDVGLRIPAASETSGALTTGLLTRSYRVGSFAPNAFPILAKINYTYANPSGLMVRLGGGPTVLFAQEGDDSDLYLTYYGQVLYGVDDFTIGGGLSGEVLTTNTGGSFSDNSISYLGFTGSYDFETVTAGAYIRTPLNDDVNTFVNFVIGLNISVSF